jgi:hypothetical protein
MISPAPPPATAWQRFSARMVAWFHAYATWLVSISWPRFFLLSVLLMIIAGVLTNLPPFNWTVSERIVEVPRQVVVKTLPKPPAPPERSASRPEALIKIEKPKPGSGDEALEISIGSHGVRITPRSAPAAASAARAAASAAQAADEAARLADEAHSRGIHITLPPGAASEEVRRAVEQAREDIRSAIEDAREAAEEARRDAEQAKRDAEQAIEELADAPRALRTRVVRAQLGEQLPLLAFLWIVASAILKISYKRQLKAEAQAAVATEVAESEQLKRQVVEARMAAMQAQVEPHFLFNTLASIDHLIETDPARASQMQKHLIALLRASMPTLREANDGGLRDLGRELAVIRPYLEILKVRMEERLVTDIQVPEGLHSAQFPPMMIQTLVENAIKHGLEPKPEGGRLTVAAEIVHGKLQVRVADTGLGFGKAATAGTGVGLANIRERLQLLYGHKATLAVTENPGGGTVVTITVPYEARVREEAAA